MTRTPASVLVRGTVFNLVGHVLPLIVALACLPIVVGGFGAARFGVLALAWAVMNAAGVFDLGLGRASTRFLSAALARDEADTLPRILGTAAAGQLAIGIAGGGLIAAAAPVLAADLFQLPADLQADGIATLRLIGLAVPVVMLTGLFQGALSASQRFDLVNLVAIPSSSSTYLLTAAAVMAGWNAPAAVALVVGAKAVALIALWRLTRRHCPGLRGRKLSPDRETFGVLLGFGSWLTVSSLLLPVLKQAERLAIPALLSVGALTFYTVPYEAVSRVAIVPISMTLALFPAFSRFDGDAGPELTGLVVRPVRYLLIMLTPALAFAALFAFEGLAVWMGVPFAGEAAPALRVLAAAFYFNAFANVLRTAIQGIGRPDLKAKLDMADAALFVGLLVALTPRFGVAGAAGARLLMTIVEVAGLLMLAYRAAPRAFHPRVLFGAIRRDLAMAVSFLVSAGLTVGWLRGSAFAYLAFGVLTAAYVTLFWRHLTDVTDRTAAAHAYSSLGVEQLRGWLSRPNR